MNGGRQDVVAPASPTTAGGGFEIGSCLVSQLIVVAMLLPFASDLGDLAQLSVVKDDDLIALNEER